MDTEIEDKQPLSTMPTDSALSSFPSETSLALMSVPASHEQKQCSLKTSSIILQRAMEYAPETFHVGRPYQNCVPFPDLDPIHIRSKDHLGWMVAHFVKSRDGFAFYWPSRVYFPDDTSKPALVVSKDMYNQNCFSSFFHNTGYYNYNSFPDLSHYYPYPPPPPPPSHYHHTEHNPMMMMKKYRHQPYPPHHRGYYPHDPHNPPLNSKVPGGICSSFQSVFDMNGRERPMSYVDEEHFPDIEWESSKECIVRAFNGSDPREPAFGTVFRVDFVPELRDDGKVFKGKLWPIRSWCDKDQVKILFLNPFFPGCVFYFSSKSKG